MPLNHVALTVTNRERSAAFYVLALSSGDPPGVRVQVADPDGYRVEVYAF